jgi:superfamily II helicase
MIIKTYLDKANGVQISVVMLRNGRYSVVTYDIDAMQYLSGCMVFLDRSQAIAYARRCVESEPMVASW